MPPAAPAPLAEEPAAPLPAALLAEGQAAPLAEGPAAPLAEGRAAPLAEGRAAPLAEWPTERCKVVARCSSKVLCYLPALFLVASLAEGLDTTLAVGKAGYRLPCWLKGGLPKGRQSAAWK